MWKPPKGGARLALEFSVQVEGLAPEYQRLERRERLARRFTRPADPIGRAGALGFAVAFLLSLSGAFSLPLEILLYAYLLSIAMMGLGLLLETRARPYALETEEMLFLGVYRTLLHLLDCLADPLPKFKKQAESELRKVIRRMDQSWKLDFKLARDVMSPVLDFRQDLKKLPPLIQNASPDQLKLFLQILFSFGDHLQSNSLSLDAIAQINKLLSGISPAPGSSGRSLSSMVEWFKVHSMLPKGTLLVLTLSSGPILFIVTTSYDFDKNVSLLAGTTASVGLTAAYVNYLRKK